MLTILAGAIGNCVHVAGVCQFLKMAEELGYRTHFLGAAVPVESFIQSIKEYKPDIVGISYRLTPETGEKLLSELDKRIRAEGLQNRKFIFGGTPPVCQAAEKTGLFSHSFNGLENPHDVWRYLGGCVTHKHREPADNLADRITDASGYPLLRHHFGLPDLEETIKGVERISAAGTTDIISLAPDQNAQESFFRPNEIDPILNGAGGVPIRSREDLNLLYQASRQGNKPLLRIYSGTRDLIQWAEMASDTIKNAWGAVPLCWYNALDRRSQRIPEDAIGENQKAMAWYGRMGIPLEVNESHHWSLREAHDTIAVVTAYLAAYNAKAAGVHRYIAQYMFNSPPTTSAPMDLAKMMAKMHLIESLHDNTFYSYRQVRAGLLHLSPRLNLAKGQLAASTMLAMHLKPQIIHVVGFCEGDHAATADDVIESCEIVHGVLKNCLGGLPDITNDSRIIARRDQLLADADVLIDALCQLGEGAEDPLTSPRVLAQAIKCGILDAPHLKGNPFAAGELETRCLDGAVYAWEREENRILSERERLKKLE